MPKSTLDEQGRARATGGLAHRETSQPELARAAADGQRQHWDWVYRHNEEFFGEEPSRFAQNSLAAFREKGVKSLLELGSGQGRDTLFFAAQGLEVVGLDYSAQSAAELQAKAEARSLSNRVKVRLHDVRQPLPFPDESFEAAYAHMLLCMHLSQREIAMTLGEIHRVLMPGGLLAYSVRNNFDQHCGTGRHLGERIYEISGFAVHFFSEEMIRQLARGYEILKIDRLDEGSLPRDLFTVFLQKSGPLPALEDGWAGQLPPTSPVQEAACGLAAMAKPGGT